MAVIPAVVTNLARERWPKMVGGLLAHKVISKYRVGEGGWIFNGITLQREPRVPDASLTDLDIITDASRPLISKRYNVAENFGWYEKNLNAGAPDFVFEPPTTLRVSCVLDNAEYNLENAGTLVYDVGGPYVAPEIWEIGLYDQDGVMVAYGTFPKETKTAAIQIENFVRLIY